MMVVTDQRKQRKGETGYSWLFFAGEVPGLCAWSLSS
jgi:hypothetical protein